MRSDTVLALALFHESFNRPKFADVDRKNTSSLHSLFSELNRSQGPQNVNAKHNRVAWMAIPLGLERESGALCGVA